MVVEGRSHIPSPSPGKCSPVYTDTTAALFTQVRADVHKKARAHFVGSCITKDTYSKPPRCANSRERDPQEAKSRE